MTVKLTPRDIGFAIRDFLEDRDISAFEDHPQVEGELIEHPAIEVVTIVDVGDPSQPVIFLGNGQKFLIRISEA